MGAGEVEVEVGEVLMFVNFMGDERRRGGGVCLSIGSSESSAKILCGTCCVLCSIT